jgi:hypothetical protein
MAPTTGGNTSARRPASVPMIGAGPWCFRVLARRHDGATQGGQIVTDWTQLGGFNTSWFQFTGPPTGSGTLQPTSSQYLIPSDGFTTPRTPLFAWSPVPGANGYVLIDDQLSPWPTTSVASPTAGNPTGGHSMLYWRVAAIDQGGNVGAYDGGVFHAPHKAKPKKQKKRKKKKK